MPTKQELEARIAQLEQELREAIRERDQAYNNEDIAQQVQMENYNKLMAVTEERDWLRNLADRLTATPQAGEAH